MPQHQRRSFPRFTQRAWTVTALAFAIGLVAALAVAAPALAAPTATLLKDIRTTGPEGSAPTGLTTVGTTIFFQAQDPTHGYELWKSNGTTAGTQLVKDIRVGSLG